jgi:hypothetical protein
MTMPCKAGNLRSMPFICATSLLAMTSLGDALDESFTQCCQRAMLGQGSGRGGFLQMMANRVFKRAGVQCHGAGA